MALTFFKNLLTTTLAAADDSDADDGEEEYYGANGDADLGAEVDWSFVIRCVLCGSGIFAVRNIYIWVVKERSIQRNTSAGLVLASCQDGGKDCNTLTSDPGGESALDIQFVNAWYPAEPCRQDVHLSLKS